MDSLKETRLKFEQYFAEQALYYGKKIVHNHRKRQLLTYLNLNLPKFNTLTEVKDTYQNRLENGEEHIYRDLWQDEWASFSALQLSEDQYLDNITVSRLILGGNLVQEHIHFVKMFLFIQLLQHILKKGGIKALQLLYDTEVIKRNYVQETASFDLRSIEPDFFFTKLTEFSTDLSSSSLTKKLRPLKL